MTPEVVRELFNANAIVIMFVFGLVWKYAPKLKEYTNDLIPWLNVIGFILAALVGANNPGSVPAVATGAVEHQSLGSTVLHAITNTGAAAAVFEMFGRTLIRMVKK
jgi:hypothetical protein